MTVKLLHCLIVQSEVIGLIISFTHIDSVKYVINTHVFVNKESWGCFQSLVKTNRAVPILQLDLVILATLREYSNSFLYWNHAICSEIIANFDFLHNKTTAFTTTS